MRQFTSLTDPALAARLNQGGVVVIPTDTIYGIVARTSHKSAVERVYALRGRAPDKPCVVLIAGRWQIGDAGRWTEAHKKLADTYWPGALSLVAPVTEKTPHYLHRGTHTLAYRVPDNAPLRALLAATGPLIAPSANPEGQPPAATLVEAMRYFGASIEGYVKGDESAHSRGPSTVAGVKDGAPHIFRQGSVRIL